MVYTWRGKDIHSLTETEAREALECCIKDVIRQRESKIREQEFFEYLKEAGDKLNKSWGCEAV